MVALNVVDLSFGERPADYQRRYSGRTLWKTIQTDVEELLPLPSYNLDTATAPESPTIKSSSKIAALQQLLKWAPDAIQEGSFDKCKHPLHSWMCQKTVVRTTSPPPPPPPSTKAPEEPRFPDASNIAEMKLIPVTPTTPSKTYTRKPSNDVDLCSNPFYSWRCNPEQLQNPDASNLDEKQLVPEILTPAPPLKPSTKKPSGWDGVDPCTHAFHSWLCKPAPKPRTIAPPTSSVPEASSKKPVETTYIPPPPPVIEQEASNSEDSGTLLYLPPEEATEEPQASYIPPPLATEAPEIVYIPPAPTTAAPEVSYLPPPPSTEAPESYLPPPLPTDTSETYLPPPSSTKTPEAPEPSYLPPPPSNPPPLEPASSNQVGNQLIPDATPQQPPTKSGWDSVDPCSHPFHSWLCNRSKNSGNHHSTARSSWKRIGRQSTPWDIENHDDIIYSWINFEPKRISAI